MATRTISTKLTIEGESQYRQAVSSINNSLKTLNSELARVESEYRNNANSTEALRAKSDVLSRAQETQRAKVEQTSAALQNAQKAQQAYGYQVEQSSHKLAGARAKLEELKRSTSDTSVQQQKLTAEVEKHEKALSASQAKLNTATRAVSDWQRSTNYAQRDLNNLDEELSRNRRYLDEAARSADGCASSIDRFGNEVNESGGAMETLASALAAAGVAAALKEITGALKECVDAAIAFESAMAGVQRTVGGTDTELAAFAGGFKAMSLEIPITTTALGKIAETAGQLGISRDRVAEFTKVMAMLATTTDLGADTAATMLAQFANITGLTDYERLGSVVAQLGDATATTASKVVEMSQGMAAAASIAGMSERDILSIAAAVGSLGIEAEAGSTALSTLISDMFKTVETGGEKLGQFASIAGMSAQEFASRWRTDAVGALDAFIKGLNDTERNGKSAVILLDELGITNVRQTKAILGLASAGDLLSNTIQQANQAWDENVALADKANIMYETTESKLAMMGNASNNVKIAIGDALSPALKEIAEVGTGAFSWAAEFVEQSPWLVQAMTGVLTTAGVLTAGIALYASATKIAAVRTKVLEVSMKLLKSAAGPVVLAISALAGLAVAFGTLAASSKEASEANRELVDSLQESRRAYEENQAAFTKDKENTMASVSAITELSAVEHKSVAQKETLLGLIQQLNKEVPGLNLAYDDQTNSLNLTTEALLAMVEAQALEEERAAAVERMVALERERMQIENDLTAAVAEQEAAIAAKNKAMAEGIYSDIGCIEQAAALDDAVKSTTKVVKELTEQQQINRDAMAEATAAYGDLQEAAEQSGEISEELTQKTTALTDSQDNLAAALAEQEAQGSLSVETQQMLIAAGYEAALSTDAETGAVTLNEKAYIDAARAKIEGQIATLEGERASAAAKAGLMLEAKAANDAAIAYYNKAKAIRVAKNANKDELDAQRAAAAQVSTYDKQIAALNETNAALGEYAKASTAAARTSSSTSRKAQTQAEKDLAAYKKLRNELDHSLAMGDTKEKEYYKQLSQYRDKYLTDDANVDEYRKINEEIFKYDQKLADQEQALWEEQTGKLISAIEERFKAISEEQSSMASKLAGYGDLFKIEDEQLSLESIQAQMDAIDAYGKTLEGLKEKGLSAGLLDEIVDMDVEDATAYGESLLGMSDTQWGEYNALWDEKQARAIEIAEQFYKDELETLKTEYDDKLKDALDPLKLTAFTSGQDTAQGLIDGLSAKEAELYAKAAAIAKEMERILSSGTTGTPEVDGSHAMGLPYVPFDGYVAELHQGERVLTEAEAREYIARSVPSSYELPRSTAPDIGSMLSQAVNAIGTTAASNGGNYRVEIPIVVNGREFSRAVLPDLRSVIKSSPEVVSD